MNIRLEHKLTSFASKMSPTSTFNSFETLRAGLLGEGVSGTNLKAEMGWCKSITNTRKLTKYEFSQMDSDVDII